MAVLSYDLTFRIFLFDICNVMIRESKNSTCLSNNKNALKHINSYTVIPLKFMSKPRTVQLKPAAYYCVQWQVQDFPDREVGEGVLTPKVGAPTHYLVKYFPKTV